MTYLYFWIVLNATQPVQFELPLPDKIEQVGGYPSFDPVSFWCLDKLNSCYTFIGCN